MLNSELSLSQEPTSKMADYSDLKEGQKVVFRHKIGGAGHLAKTEKVGYIEDLDDPERDFPVKIRIGAEEVLDEDDPVKTYVEPSEINNIIGR
jgi:hypothetical protein